MSDYDYDLLVIGSGPAGHRAEAVLRLSGYREREIYGSEEEDHHARPPLRDPHIPFDGRPIFVSDDILEMEDLPKTLAECYKTAACDGISRLAS